MSDNIYASVAVIIMAGVTLLLRVVPFIILGKRETPRYVAYLGKVLPYAIMGMLVVYCLKGVSFVDVPFGIPELISIVLVAVLHVWKRNTLFSIIGGTVCYMMLIHII